VAKKVHVRVNETRTLYFDFYYKGVRCKEYTQLTDIPDNRKRCEKLAQIIGNEIDLGKFDYLRIYPTNMPCLLYGLPARKEDRMAGRFEGLRELE
jgi:integrase